MSWTILTFGKHAGKSLPQVLFSDPDWFFWAVEEGAFAGKGQLSDEADLLESRARHIRIPTGEDGEPMEAEYVIAKPSGKLGTVQVVPATQPKYPEDPPRHSCFDLSVPRQIAHFDKLGGKNMLRVVKRHLFGSKPPRMTRARCEAFFDDTENFLGPG